MLIIPVVLCVSFIVYALVDLAPGDVVDTMITSEMTAEDVIQLRILYDLDKPMIYRYGKYMFKLIQGDLGVSDISKSSVWEAYVERLPNTLKLTLSGLIIGVVCAIPLGIFASKRAGTIADSAATVFAVLGISMPSFWLGLLFQQLFSLKLGWLPAGGMNEGIRSLIMPAVCSGLMLMATATRQTRSSMVDVLKADYLRTARAKGVPEKVVIRKHALGNALIPIVTVIGSSLSMALAGSVVVEQVFAWPGVGRLAVEAVGRRDVPTVLGTVIMTTTIYVFIQICVDITYTFVDPRIKSRYVKSGKRVKHSAVKTAASPAVQLQKSGEQASAEVSATPVSTESAAAGAAANIAAVKQDETLTAKESVAQKAQSVQTPKKDETVQAADSEKASGAQAVAAKQTRTYEDIDKKEIGIAADTSGGLVTKKYAKRSQFADIFYRLRKNKGSLIGMIIISAIILCFLVSL